VLAHLRLRFSYGIKSILQEHPAYSDLPGLLSSAAGLHRFEKINHASHTLRLAQQPPYQLVLPAIFSGSPLGLHIDVPGRPTQSL